MLNKLEEIQHLCEMKELWFIVDDVSEEIKSIQDDIHNAGNVKDNLICDNPLESANICNLLKIDILDKRIEEQGCNLSWVEKNY